MFSRSQHRIKPALFAAGALILIALACSLESRLAPERVTPTASAEVAVAPCSPGIDLPTIPAAQSTPEPGLVLRGCVRVGDMTSGKALDGVSIYRNFASYEAVLVATTDASGYYESAYQYIPGDEMVGVYAQKDGYTFEPSIVRWRHYYGYEVNTIDFTAKSK